SRIVVTVEDPVECAMEGATQVQIKPWTGMGWIPALRALMRTDPDVFFISELQNAEIISMAVKAALTGHVAIGQFDAADASELLQHLATVEGLDHGMLASSLIAVIAQTLVRKLCDCKRKTDAPSGIGFKDAYEPVGCGKCMQTGYCGHLAVNDIVLPNRELKSAIAARDAHLIAALTGNRLREGALSMVEKGETSLMEVSTIFGC
ncbi:MAG: ATPase, T2SS/T4P/T4SS family, partial [Candidatus Wallbacteria bacterium]|nr:ATPase, T2SS/T4P/T4SS family [Candidatus Wallbacteria bacterium]